MQYIRQRERGFIHDFSLVNIFEGGTNRSKEKAQWRIKLKNHFSLKWFSRVFFFIQFTRENVYALLSKMSKFRSLFEQTMGNNLKLHNQTLKLIAILLLFFFMDKISLQVVHIFMVDSSKLPLLKNCSFIHTKNEHNSKIEKKLQRKTHRFVQNLW